MFKINEDMEFSVKGLIERLAATGEPFEMNEAHEWVSRHTEVTLRKVQQTVYNMVHRHELVRVGTGQFRNMRADKAVFSVELSEQEQKLSRTLRLQFPELTCCLFNGSVLARLGGDRRGDRMTYVMVERFAIDKVYQYLKGIYPAVWLSATDAEEELPTDRSQAGIVVRPLHIKAPIIRKDGQVFPALEQLLVDVRKDLAFAHLPKEETDTIWAKATERYYINVSRLKGYAKRRHLELDDYQLCA